MATERLPLAEDTPLDVEDVQLGIWRAMTPATKATIIAGICEGVYQLAVEGVRRRHPTAGARELFLRLAVARLGYDLAVEAFPDAAGLTA